MRRDHSKIVPATWPGKMPVTHPKLAKRNVNLSRVRSTSWSIRSWESVSGTFSQRAGGLPRSHGPGIGGYGTQVKGRLIAKGRQPCPFKRGIRQYQKQSRWAKWQDLSKPYLNQSALSSPSWSMRSWESEPGTFSQRAGGFPGSHGPGQEFYNPKTKTSLTVGETPGHGLPPAPAGGLHGGTPRC